MAAPGPVTGFETEVLEVIERNPNVKSFRFERKGDAGFTAGQYFFLTINTAKGEKTKPFSFSSSPTEKGYLEFTKKLTASEFSKKLSVLSVGEKVRLRMPYGEFSLPPAAGKIALISGGIGITPFRSMCKYATDIAAPVDIVLLYGNRTLKEIIFREDLDKMQEENKNLKVVYTLDSLEGSEACKCARKGVIDSCMISKEIPDLNERLFYLCGPPGMVTCLADVLEKDLKVSKLMVRTEKFAGY